MAKGQMRKTREVRKPKKDKAAPKPETGFANQLKQAETTGSSRPKGKG